MKQIAIIILSLVTTIRAAEIMDLPVCRQKALAHNHQMKIAEQEMAVAMQNRKATFTNFLPRVDLVGNYTHTNNYFRYQYDLSGEMGTLLNGIGQYYSLTNGGANLLVDDPLYRTLAAMGQNGLLPTEIDLTLGEKNTYILTTSLTQPLYAGGKIRNLYQISRLLENIARANKDLTESQTIEKVDELYWQLVALRAKVELAARYLEAIEAHYRDLQNYHAEGLVTDNILLTVQVKRDEAGLSLFKAQNGVKLVQMALCQIIGYPLDWEIIPEASLDGEYLSFVQNANFMVGKSLRPEITILENSVAVANRNVNIARSRYLPNVVLTANYIGLNPNPYNSFKREFGSDIAVGLSAQMDIFHWNERGHQLAAAIHTRKVCEAKLAETRELITLETQQAVFRLNESARRVEMTANNVKQAEENLRITENNFREGLCNSSDVLDAQVIWQRACSENIDSKTEYRLNEIRLKKALGELHLDNKEK